MRPRLDLNDTQPAGQIADWCTEHINPMCLFSDWDLQKSSFGQEVRVEKAGGLEVLAFGPDEPGGIVAWGYPHPDEPLGATALESLAEALSWGQELPGPLAGMPVRIVLCADPAGAQMNRRWIESGSVEDWARFHHRPLGPGCEVDYSFPINQFPHRSPNYEVMRESRWLADLITRNQPDVVGLMHNSLLGADFTFLSHQPEDGLVLAIDSLQRQLGRERFELPGQPGELLVDGRYDLLGERTLTDRLAVCERQNGPLKPGQVLLGAASAAMFCQTRERPPVVVTPEASIMHCHAPQPGYEQMGRVMVRELSERAHFRFLAARDGNLTFEQAERVQMGAAGDLRFQAQLTPEIRKSDAAGQWATELMVAGRLGLLAEIAGPASHELESFREMLLSQLPEDLYFINGCDVADAAQSIIGRLLLCAAASRS